VATTRPARRALADRSAVDDGLRGHQLLDHAVLTNAD
jgi:hypothetical protein